MPKVTIRGKQCYVRDVFSDEFVFSIPVYQRPYAWAVDEAGELYDDILGFLGEEEKAVDELNPYFLGSIVLIKEEGSPEAQIVDGQQRLITLTILLAALRNKASALPGKPSKKMAGELTSFILEEGSSLRRTKDRFRLTPRPRDAQFFKTYIQDEDGMQMLERLNSAELNDSQQNFRQNALLYLQLLEVLNEQQRNRFADYLTNQCCLVVVSTPNLESAFRVFTVLNGRGLELFYTDILKSEIIGAVPSDLRTDYGNKWEDIEEYLGRNAFKDLFSHIRMMYRKRKLGGTILSEVKEYVRPAAKPQVFVDDILTPMAQAFHTIITQSYSSEHRAEGVNHLLKWLNRIDNVDWIPPAIIYLSKYHAEPDKLVRFFTDLERLAGGLMIRRANINERIKRYAKLIEAIEENNDLFTPDSPLQLTSDDKTSIMAMLDGDIYLVGKIYRYVLLRLDTALSQGEAKYQYSVISVEHVLPQTPKPNSQWLVWFPNEEDRRMWVHRLGNLALLSTRKNIQAQNYEFDMKKAKYFAIKEGVSPFPLTTQVLQEAEWTPEVLEKRQKELLNVFSKMWRLN